MRTPSLLFSLDKTPLLSPRRLRTEHTKGLTLCFQDTEKHTPLRCLFTWLSMPVYTVADACYTPITGIPYCRARHLQHSCKASERVLGGIVINVPSVLLCRDDSLTPGKRFDDIWTGLLGFVSGAPSVVIPNWRITGKE